MKAIKLKKGTAYVHFGWAATRDFAAAANRTLKQLETIENDMNPGDMLALIWAGLKQGARKKGKEFNLSTDDVGDLLDENPQLLEQAMQEYTASQALPVESPNAQRGANPKEKKQRKPKS